MLYFQPLEVGCFTVIPIIVPLASFPRSAVIFRAHGCHCGYITTWDRSGSVAISLGIGVHRVVHIVLTAFATSSDITVAVTHFILCSIGKDGNINPRGRSPPRVIVTLFRTLQAVPIAIGVLSSTSAVVTPHLLVSCIQSFSGSRLVSLTGRGSVGTYVSDSQIMLLNGTQTHPQSSLYR